MIRLETLIELNFLNSSHSSSNCSIRFVRAYPLVEIRQTAPVEQFEATLSQSTVPSPLLTPPASFNHTLAVGDCPHSTRITEVPQVSYRDFTIISPTINFR